MINYPLILVTLIFQGLKSFYFFFLINSQLKLSESIPPTRYFKIVPAKRLILVLHGFCCWFLHDMFVTKKMVFISFSTLENNLSWKFPANWFLLFLFYNANIYNTRRRRITCLGNSLLIDFYFPYFIMQTFTKKMFITIINLLTILIDDFYTHLLIESFP